MVEDDEASFVEHLVGEVDYAFVGGVDGGAHGSAEVGTFVNAGELAVEGAAGAEGIGRREGDRRGEVAGPERVRGGAGEGCVLEHFFLRDAGQGGGRWGKELGFDLDGGGAVRGRADGDGAGEELGGAGGEGFGYGDGVGAGGLLNVYASKDEPGFVVGGMGEGEGVGEPGSSDGSGCRGGHGEEDGGAAVQGGGGAGDLGVGSGGGGCEE